MMKYIASFQRWILTILMLLGGYMIFTNILFVGIAENDITKAIIGAILDGGILIWVGQSWSFYFRTSSPAEKTDAANNLK